MSSNFDFPPASDSSTPIGSLTRRFDNLRQTFQTEREERRERGSFDNGMPTPPPSMPRPRRRMHATPRSAGSAPSMRRPRSPASLSTSPGFPPIQDRYRQMTSANRQQLRRLRQEVRDESLSAEEELMRRRELLEAVNSHLDDTETSIRGFESPTSTSPLRRRSHKRRKLDHDHDSTPAFDWPQPYGYYGQVDAGQLRMEIVSCDGGQHQPRNAQAYSLDNYRANYSPENVLKDNTDVYCSKRSQCNLILQQKGEALFHLESLVIAAPKHGYTAPARRIQQGLVFVGMSAEKLSSATSSYAIQYSDDASNATRTRSPTPDIRPSERLSLLEAVNDDQIWQASRSRYGIPDPRTLPAPRPSQSRLVRTINVDPGPLFMGTEEEPSQTSHGNAFLDNCDWPPATIDPISSNLTRAPTPPPFTVTMDSSEDETVNRRHREREHSYGPYGLPPLLPVDMGTDSDTSIGGNSDFSSIARRASRLNHSIRRSRPVRRGTPGDIGREDSLDREEEVIEPNARFFMPEGDCRITVRFQPPVAGKFILLKLFSPQLHDGKNIDVQFVAAHGFSGPRFFPSVEMR